MEFKKILVINGHSIGDVILTTPVLKMLKDRFPDSKLLFLVKPEIKVLMERLSFIDEIICYKKGMPIFPVLKKIWKSDVAICLDERYRSALLPFFACIPRRVGLKNKRKLFLTNYTDFLGNEDNIYESLNFVNIINRTLNLNLSGNYKKLYISEANREEKIKVNNLFQSLDKNKKVLAVAPFSSSVEKDWPLDSYKILFRTLNKNKEYQFVILGTEEDRKKGSIEGNDIHDWRALTSLVETGEILRRVDCFLGGCSGPLHIAAAMNTPKVALYGPSSYHRWAPIENTIVVQAQKGSQVSDKMENIKIEWVLEACKNVLGQSYI